MNKITDLLGQKILFFDGAMGTMLQGSGLKAGELPELLNITNPGLITSIHKQYYDCGIQDIAPHQGCQYYAYHCLWNDSLMSQTYYPGCE